MTWVIVATPNDRHDERDRTGSDRPPTLADHAEAVRNRASRFASAAGLPPSVVAALELAARSHDHGKADPRVQTFFRRGVEPIGQPLLAKSVFGTRDPRTSRIAANLAGLPQGLHHEIASVAILADALEREESLREDVDWELALHLVATHHGRARPIPAVPNRGAAPRAFHCDAAGVAGTARGDGTEGWMSGEGLSRFWSVIERYGAWGTAYLEALLMLADRTVSSEGR
jgi:CRISPR-associated endonuclease/helicase Cas3